MKSLNRYIQEKYLIDFDTQTFDLDNCFDNREPDFIANSAKDLSKFDSNISKEIIEFINSYTKNMLYVWKYKYSTTADYDKVANASQYRRIKTGYNKSDITTLCDVKLKNSNGIEIMILVDKKDSKIIPEIWIINNSKPEYCLYIEPQK